MWTDKFALVCALLVLSTLEPITAKKGFSGGGGRSRGGGHSYPHSGGGLSGSGGHHGYPSSGGLSGSGGGSHGYPASGGLSGGGSHGYPSHGGTSGGSHGYPSSGGSHGYPSSGGSHGYPSSGGGLSGSGSSNSHGYPAGKGLSGNTGSHSTTTNVHHHYHYAPPKEIRYTPVHGVAQSYPVYRGSPPTYVYKYKDSGSKYGTLLAGLALFNLGALAGGAAGYAIGNNHHGSGSSHYNNYKPQPGEYCKFGVKKDNGDYEETRIDCQLITSFIMQADQAQPQSGGGNKTIVTTSVTNVTTVNMTNGVPQHPPMNTTRVGDKLYQIMPDGTLIPVNETALNMTTNANGVSSMVTTVTNTTTVKEALDVKGQPIAVTPGMQCFVIRHTPVNEMRKTVPCGLLQTYAETSLKRNSAGRNTPAFTILAVVLAAFIMH